MTLDPRNLPFERPASFVEVSRSGSESELRAESILLEEFNFAGVTAYQSREDSAALINIYLLATGALATGLGVMVNAYTNGTRSTIGIIATTAMVIFAVISFAFFTRFLALEQEYRESMLAMGVIKEYYIQRLRRETPEIELAFRWRLKKRPRGATHAGGVPLIAATFALLGGLSVAGAVGEGRQLYSILAHIIIPYTPEPVAFSLKIPFFWEIFLGLLTYATYAIYFFFIVLRRRRRTQEEAIKQSERIEAALASRP